MAIRNSLFDGQFYSANFQELDKQIKECFLNKFGPGELPSKRNKKIFGVIAPHAGYMFSGPCMAYSYKEIAESKFPETYIILGTSHSGFSGTLLKDYKTPFGLVKTDQELAKHLMKKLPFFKESDLAHKAEHSIEVQLPFLQFVSKDNLKELKILPIVCNYTEEQIVALTNVLQDTNKQVFVIASSDFTHFGSAYGYLPFRNNIKENLYKLDKEAINFIEKLNHKGFLNLVSAKELTICGYKAIFTAIQLTKLFGSKKAKLLKYYTSGDIVNDYNNAVGYASIAFE